jgi:NAD(P)-dependent dehydrogenase (short-subunit alcohol dehydrogenase family)
MGRAKRGKAQPLSGQVAIVAGATRGAGRGIARGLGEAGATVYCTGRSTRAAAGPSGRPETIEETAELVDAAGGRGIAVRVDHTVEAEVAALIARVGRDHGRLDVLVNDVWGGEKAIDFGKPMWELGLEAGFALYRQAVWSHVITSRHAAPMMIAARRGLIVEITDGDTLCYRGHFLYDLIKTSVIRLAYGLAAELRPHKVAAVAVTPGFLRSEEMLAHFGVTAETWRDGIAQDRHFAASETPLFVGRAVAALAGAPARALLARSGQALSSWRLAREFRFTDEDGTRPDWGRHFAAEIPARHFGRVSMERSEAWLGEMLAVTRGFTAPPAMARRPSRPRARARAR